jgi:hypothetical protein
MVMTPCFGCLSPPSCQQAQAATKFELSINLKTAKELDLKVPPARNCRQGSRIALQILAANEPPGGISEVP